MYYLLLYNFVENFENLRKPFRKEHLNLVDYFFQSNFIIGAGAIGFDLDSGLIIFKVTDEAKIYEFIESDPYYKNGLVLKSEVKPWHVVKIGS